MVKYSIFFSFSPLPSQTKGENGNFLNFLLFSFLFPMFQTNYTSERERERWHTLQNGYSEMLELEHKQQKSLLGSWTNLKKVNGRAENFHENRFTGHFTLVFGIVFPKGLAEAIDWSKLSESGLSESFSWSWFPGWRKFRHIYKCGCLRVSIGWKVGSADEFRSVNQGSWF